MQRPPLLAGLLSYLFFTLATLAPLYAQLSRQDSLRAVLQVAQKQERVEALLALAQLKFEAAPADGLQEAQQALMHAKALGSKEGEWQASLFLGKYYRRNNFPEKAVDFFHQAYTLLPESAVLQDRIEILLGLVNMHNRLNQEAEALGHSLTFLQLTAKPEAENYRATAHMLVAKQYIAVEKYTEARAYVMQARQIDSLRGNRYGLAVSLNSLGAIFHKEHRYEEAITHYTRAQSIFESLHETKQVARVNSNLGEVYTSLKNYKKALNLFIHAYEVIRKEKDVESEIATLRRISNVHYLQGQYKNALRYELEAKRIAEKESYKAFLAPIYSQLSHIYENLGNYPEALTYAWLYAHIQDEVQKENKDLALAERESRHTLAQRERELELLTKEKSLQDAQHARDELFVNSAVAVVVMVLLLAFVLFRRNREKQRANALLYKQKKEVEGKRQELELLNQAMIRQKEEITSQRDSLKAQHKQLSVQHEEIAAQKNELSGLVAALNQTNAVLATKNQQVTSSINYAKRIQDAMLPSERDIQKALPDSFVFFKPRDIVSGDFYWFTVIEEFVFLAAADCTGHGVPGAFMSMMGEAYLSQIVTELRVSSPALILERLNRSIQKSLRQGKTQNRDGMDVALTVIDQAQNILRFAGAHNPLVYVQSGELHYIRGDRKSIGGRIMRTEKFKEHQVEIHKSLIFYLYSDGFQDQFGGEKGEKYYSRRFREFLFSGSGLPFNAQKQRLEEEFTTWRGTQHRQLDDVLVIGAKISPSCLLPRE